MNNFTKFLIGLGLLLLLLFLGSWWVINKSGINPCSVCGMPWTVADGGKTIASADYFNFARQGAVPNVPATTDAALGDVATYMKNNKERQLTLTGLYDDEEKHLKGKLGLDRAESIKTRLVKKGVPAAQILTKSAEKKNLEFPDNKLMGGVGFAFAGMAVAKAAKAAPKTNLVPNLLINDRTGEKLNINVPQNIGFQKSGYEVKTPLASPVEGAYKQVAGHLNKYPQKTLTLTGLYEKGEKNNSVLPNLGMARANSVKNQLVRMGAKGSQIETEGRLIDKLLMKDGLVLGGMDYLFENGKAVDNSRLPAIEKAWKANPITLYFQTNSDQVILNEQQRKMFADLIYYLDRKNKGGVTVTGHTDNVGAAAGNLALSGRRADFIKAYLGRNGVNSRQIAASGKGLTTPIATNDTPEGRAKNRRVEVRLK